MNITITDKSANVYEFRDHVVCRSFDGTISWHTVCKIAAEHGLSEADVLIEVGGLDIVLLTN